MREWMDMVASADLCGQLAAWLPGIPLALESVWVTLRCVSGLKLYTDLLKVIPWNPLDTDKPEFVLMQ